MSISRETVDRGEIDLSDVSTGCRLPPVHPGEILRDEFLKPMDLSAYALARALKISRPRLHDIVLGRRGVTTDTALRLGRYFGMPAEYWINLQTRYDLDIAERTVRSRIEREVEPRAGAVRTVGAEPAARRGRRAIDIRWLVSRTSARTVR